jgi:hypothetical protein
MHEWTSGDTADARTSSGAVRVTAWPCGFYSAAEGGPASSDGVVTAVLSSVSLLVGYVMATTIASPVRQKVTSFDSWQHAIPSNDNGRL